MSMYDPQASMPFKIHDPCGHIQTYDMAARHLISVLCFTILHGSLPYLLMLRPRPIIWLYMHFVDLAGDTEFSLLFLLCVYDCCPDNIKDDLACSRHTKRPS
ncbi:hypothetical protein BCR43DRAFT_488820 [Syncephalastrum racemosum]|uniref:Uncharacterized protein n=1 Tax=Syncephalastrum racemosum TaxID=13706 RepID=A0A1X2HJ84_SYNRA|nr:hypothetical protein BCR43DRAFT_488820 [Syncephalastrum racemosum]